MKKIILNSFNRGGLADSKYSGVKYSSARMVGMNIHDTVGLLQANPKSTSMGTIDEFCKASLKASNGTMYWFSSESGKIWKQVGSTITLLHTVSVTSGTANIVSAHEHHGYVYFATNYWLHRFSVSSETFTDNWHEFPNHDSEHPMAAVNLNLYIGDNNDVHMVDSSGAWTSEALDLPTGYDISSLGSASTYLLVGATFGNHSTIFRWNTWSVSFQSADDVPEPKIHSFIQADNYVLVYAGYSGSIYYYNMEGLLHFKRIKGEYTPSAKAVVYPYATDIYLGSRYLFGVSNTSGTPCDAGIYSLARYSESYPLVLNLEYPISQTDSDGYNKTGDVQIGAVLVDDINVYWSWKDGSTAGVDKLDYSYKIAKPFLETRVIVPESAEEITVRKIVVGYESLPSTSSIVVKYSQNYGSWVTATTTTDTDRNQIVADSFSISCRAFQVRVEMTNTTSTPKIDEITVYIE